jgi:hypothetical protein
MINPRQRQRIKFAEALVTYATRTHQEEMPSRLPWLPAIHRLFSLGSAPVYVMSGVLLVVIGGAALWFNLDRPEDVAWVKAGEPVSATLHDESASAPPTGRSNSLPRSENKEKSVPPVSAKQAEKVSPQMSKPERAFVGTLATIVLSVGATREGGPEKMFTVPSGAGLVKLRMDTDTDDRSRSFFVNVETVEGEQIWARKVPQAGKGRQYIDVSIPARLLKRGDYIVTLKGLTAAGVYETVSEYSFSLHRGR